MLEWFKKIGLQIKVVFGIFIGIAGFILFFFVREKIRARDKLTYELRKLEHEIRNKELGKDISSSEMELDNLRKQEAIIREKLKLLDEIEVKEEREVSLEELDAFFDSRGF